ncbi:MAG: hypothetical protein AAF623_00695 [Planctomycetota bacterium]
MGNNQSIISTGATISRLSVSSGSEHGLHKKTGPNGLRLIGTNYRLGNLNERETTMSLVGKPAVDFELPDAFGSVHRLSDYRGQWLLMIFHRHLG